jgi:hypothetical protein
MALGLSLFASAAHAQNVREGFQGSPFSAPRWSSEAAMPKRLGAAGSSAIGQFASIELSGLPGQRPRHSLRFRFDAATDAMRGWGVSASECATLVRSSHHRSSATAGTDAPRSFKVSLALNCRFF